MYNSKAIGWIQEPMGLKLSGIGSIPPQSIPPNQFLLSVTAACNSV